MKQLISVACEDQPDTLLRLTGLLYRRGYAVKKLTLSPAQQSGCLRITAIVSASQPTGAGLEHHIRKFLDVISVEVLPV